MKAKREEKKVKFEHLQAVQRILEENEAKREANRKKYIKKLEEMTKKREELEKSYK